MLGKLLKYDLKNIFKFLSVFYLLAVFFAVLSRIFLNIENSLIMDIIGKICSGAYIAMIFNIVFNNVIRMWVRFKGNLYGDESYLTHTLPASKSEIYLSKYLSANITLIVSVAFITATLFIAYYSKENMEILKSLIVPLGDALNTPILPLILVIIGVMFLEIACSVQAGFIGITLGHKMNNGKLGFSILFGFMAYMFIQILGLVLLFVGALFNSDLMNLFATTQMINMDLIKLLMYMALGFYGALLIVSFFIGNALLKKGVNVD